MHIHILGICGTFMGGIALLAKASGHRVSGSDANVYPPMSTQLEQAGICLMEGYDASHLQPEPDCVVVGNAMTRGNPAIEWMLEQGLRYTSGPQWLAENLLQDRWVLAVAGTHGKTTTSAMLAWILEDAGLAPGFLIGGVPLNFGESARLGNQPFFVVEADEYDTAFFDKRSKFVHYCPRTLILNNLEFDHADIFDDLQMIQRQFHHLVRIVPGNGLIVKNGRDENLQQVLDQGCWTPIESFDDPVGWHVTNEAMDQSSFDVLLGENHLGSLKWGLTGRHNLQNALAAIAAARHAGVPVKYALQALATFRNVKRRMELRGEVDGIKVFDDFAHHPTAIRLTLEGLKATVQASGNGGRVIVVLDPCSNTMRQGVHAEMLPSALAEADQVILHVPEDLGWNPAQIFHSDLEQRIHLAADVADVLQRTLEQVSPGDRVLIMSNGGFGGIHEKLLQALEKRR